MKEQKDTKQKSPNKASKPTKVTSEKIKHKLFSLFEKNIMPTEAIEITGYSSATVYRGWSKFRDAVKNEIGQDFIAQQIESKAVCVRRLQELIEYKENMVKELEPFKIYTKIMKNKETKEEIEVQLPALGVISLITTISRDIAEMEQQKNSIEMEPTLDVELERMISERYHERESSSTATQKAKASIKES